MAEFWADGPKTETPPGHWFSILNYVSDHPLFEKRFKGEGPILDDLEWDVKAYFALGGAMHDAAVTAWSIKCWYDYVRPISAIRWMADRGQSSPSRSAALRPRRLAAHGRLYRVSPSWRSPCWRGRGTHRQNQVESLGVGRVMSPIRPPTWLASAGSWPRTGGRTNGPILSPRPLLATFRGTRLSQVPLPRF